MRIAEAAGRLGISPRMLRYRESLGLLPAARSGDGAGRRAPPALRHRQFSDGDLEAITLALALGLRVLSDPRARAEVARLAARLGRLAPQPARALDFEQERARRLLGLGGPPGPERPPGQRPAAPPGLHQPHQPPFQRGWPDPRQDPG